MLVVATICLAALVGVHLAAGRLRLLDGVPRSRWLSLAGGVAVAYVFVHLLPELAEADEALADVEPLAFIERHAYLVALTGLAAFYVLDVVALRSRARRDDGPAGSPAGDGPFKLHVSSFGAYNVLIGYLVAARGEGALAELLLFTVAIAVHFVVADFGLREHHRHRYEAVVRWVLAAALCVGFIVGTIREVSDAALGSLLAFLAGAVILNTIKEEVPSERRSRLAPFIVGAAGYAAILIAM